MISQSERGQALRRLLEEHAPGACEHERVEGGAGPDRGPAAGEWFTRTTRREYGELQLQVALRGDGDVDIHFRVTGHEPDRVESHHILPEGQELDALEEVARLVGDFIAERVALGYDTSFFRGGRSFIPATDIGTVSRRKLAWLVSWRGTYDWRR